MFAIAALFREIMAALWLFVAFGYLLLYAFASLQALDLQNLHTLVGRIAN